MLVPSFRRNPGSLRSHSLTPNKVHKNDLTELTFSKSSPVSWLKAALCEDNGKDTM